MRKLSIALAAIFLFAAPAFAQRTVVTGTVQDSNGTPYATGTLVATLSLPVGVSGATLNGVQIGGATQRVSLDNTGSFLMQLPDNNVVQPPGTQWTFNVNISPGVPLPLGTGPQSCSATLTITGASQSVSGSLAACPKLSNVSGASAPGGGALLPTGIDSGVANAYVVTTTPNTVGLTLGASFTWQATHGNTAASTVNVNGTGVIALRGSNNGQASLTGAEITTGVTYTTFYDGVRWLIAGCQPGFACQAGSPLDFTKAIYIPPGNSFNVVSAALTNVTNARNMLNFFCSGQVTGCAGGQSGSLGMDGDGVWVAGTNFSGGRLGGLIGLNPEWFSPFTILGDGVAADPLLDVNDNGHNLHTSGDDFHVIDKNNISRIAIDANGRQFAAQCTSSASPATCADLQNGVVAVPAGTTTLTINSTAVTANSSFFFNRDDTLGTKLAVTCNTATVMGEIKVSGRVVGTSFTLTVQTAPAVNPGCLSFWFEN